MAIAGLHNVSAFGPFFGESQSPVSGRCDNERDRPMTRASSVLRMWRELEGDHVISPSYSSRQQRNTSNPESASIGQESDNTCNISEDSNNSENHVVASSEMEQEDNNSVTSEQSSDLGESERERVRQIFRQWKKSGASHSEVSTEADPMIERVRDNLAIHHQQNCVRRPIRKLCGRQTLVDLLLRAQCERNGELQHLSEQKPVSEFAHRNRIQALLRGRFLRNERLVMNKGQSSVAATELDYLRQRQTVSDLREEFLSKLDNSASTSSINAESDSSSNHENNSEPEPECIERKVDFEIHTILNSEPVDRNSRTPEDPVLIATQSQSENNEQEVSLSQSDHQVTLSEVQTHQNEEIELEASLPNERVSSDVESVPSSEEQILEYVMSEQDVSIDFEHSDSRISEHMDGINITNDSSFQNDRISEADAHADFLEITNQEFEHRDASVLQDSEIEIQNSSLQQQIRSFTEWTDHNREEEEDNLPSNWHETFSNQLFQETPETTIDALGHDDDRVQESHEDWQSHDLQEAIDSWLLMPSLDVGVSLGRFHYDHFPDDETTQTMEIRELSSRRRVSSLLRSSFRESLDQVLQSHVERQLHFSSGDSEAESSSPVLIGQDEEPLNVERSLTISDGIEANQFDPSLTNIMENNGLWDDQLNGENFLQVSSHQILGAEWEIINDLRIEMARLHQRMNHMQSMLEACIDMQIELQRCMRQEVSAALNRTILTRDISAKDKTIDNESQWETVRKGICCLCGESKINSLLYRCGHMCTCSECAMKLVRDNGKCPMCRAPIVEAVRAYFIQ